MPKRGINLPKERLFKGPASLIKRALAFITDLFLVSIICYPLSNIINNLMPKATNLNDVLAMVESQNTSLLTTVSIMISIISIIYFSVLEIRFNQTIGKMIANIYVVSDQKELRYWQCLVRNLFLLPFIPFILLWIIDPLYAIFTKDNRRFSDMIAKTRVIEYYRM